MSAGNGNLFWLLMTIAAFVWLLDPLESERENSSEVITFDNESAKSAESTPQTPPPYKFLLYHTKNTVFRHQSLRRRYYDEIQGYGLTAREGITFGTILAVEYPLLLPKPDKLNKLNVLEAMDYIGGMIEDLSARDSEFSMVWRSMDINNVYVESLKQIVIQNKKNITAHDIDNIAHLSTFTSNNIKFQPKAVYSILGRINFGLPANVAAIVGDRNDDYVSILIATKDLEPDEEIVIDYYYDWGDQHAIDEQKLLRQQEKNRGLGFVKGLNNKWVKISRLLREVGTSKKKRMRRLYSNGIVGKKSNKKLKITSGCAGASMQTCKIKRRIKESVASGDIFKFALGKQQPPAWAGDVINVDGQGLIKDDEEDSTV